MPKLDFETPLGVELRGDRNDGCSGMPELP